MIINFVNDLTGEHRKPRRRERKSAEKILHWQSCVTCRIFFLKPFSARKDNNIFFMESRV